MKSISLNAAVNRREDTEKDGMVSMAMKYSNEEWKTPDATWFDMETTEEGEVFFVNVVLAENEMMEQRRKGWRLSAWRRYMSYGQLGKKKKECLHVLTRSDASAMRRSAPSGRRGQEAWKAAA
jgi:hypothetical protein